VDRGIVDEIPRHVRVPGASRGRALHVRDLSGEEDDLADAAVGGAVGGIVNEVEGGREFTMGRLKLRANPSFWCHGLPLAGSDEYGDRNGEVRERAHRSLLGG